MPPIFIDRSLMTQVFFNLLDNAVKYFHGSPDQFRVTIDASRVAQKLEIRVADNGVGVKSDAINQIFKGGFRGAQTRKNTVGNGLGLWIANEIVRRHNGQIALIHTQKPTVFSVCSPVALLENPPADS